MKLGRVWYLDFSNVSVNNQYLYSHPLVSQSLERGGDGVKTAIE